MLQKTLSTIYTAYKLRSRHYQMVVAVAAVFAIGVASLGLYHPD